MGGVSGGSLGGTQRCGRKRHCTLSPNKTKMRYLGLRLCLALAREREIVVVVLGTLRKDRKVCVFSA